MSHRRAYPWLALSLLTACGRAPAPQSAPAPTRESSAEGASAAPAPPAAAPFATVAPTPTMAPGSTPVPSAASGRPPTGDAKKVGERKEDARDILKDNRRSIDDAFAALVQSGDQIARLSGSACGDACRALASMERAARTVCDLVTPDERARCDDATSRLKSARRRVRDACGTCGDGVTTDPDAPLR